MDTRQQSGKQELVSTGVSGLDTVLGGGLRPGQLYLLRGEPGIGKTTIGMQFLLEGAARGERCLHVTLSETKRELVLVADSHGWDLGGVEVFELTAAEQLSNFKNQHTVFHVSEVELMKTLETLMRVIQQHAPDRVVFDSLSEVRLLAGDSRRFRRQMLHLKAFLQQQEGTVILIDDSQEEADLQTLAHGAITLTHFTPEFGARRRQLQISKYRGMAAREGLHDFRIKRGGAVVYPRLISAESRPASQSIKRLPSGVDDLDEMVGGGLDRGSSALLVGPAGCGKSTVAAQYIFAAAQRGERSSIYLFDEARHLFLARCRSLKMPLHVLEDQGLVNLRQVDPAEFTPGEFLQRVRADVEDRGASIMVIDSVNGFMKAMPGEPYLSIHMHEMLSYLGQLNVTSLLIVAQQGLIGDMEQPVEISYLADSVLLFRFYELNGQLHPAVSMFKRRSGSHSRRIYELGFGESGLSVGPPVANLQGVLSGAPTPFLVKQVSDTG